jgi:hypothetical protein
MKFCHFQVNRWNWRTGSEYQRLHVFSHVWNIDLIHIQAILWKTGPDKGRSHKRGKKKEGRRWIWLMYFLYKNECRIFFNFYFFIHMWIQCLSHFSPLPPQPLLYHPLSPLVLLPTPSIPSRNYFALISNFVEERV